MTNGFDILMSPVKLMSVFLFSISLVNFLIDDTDVVVELLVSLAVALKTVSSFELDIISS